MLGDPAMKIYSPVQPDYTLQSNDIFVYPPNANAQMDSIAVGVIMTNLGRAKDDTISVSLIRTLPNGSTKKTYTAKLPRPLYFKDTLYIWVAIDEKNDVGNNTYEITIDKENLLTEVSDFNNTAQAIFFLPGTGIQTLLPATDQIVTKDSVQLIVQNNNLLIGNTEYLFEIDTTPSFNSALLQTSGTITSGSLARWKVTLTAPDSTVYFWRARMNIPVNEGGMWDTSSFTLIRNGSEGWTQSHFFQYSRHVSAIDKIIFDGGKLDFIDNFHDVIATQARWLHGGLGILDPYPLTPNVFACIGSGGVVAIVFDARSLNVKDADGFPRNCNPASHPTAFYYTFDTKTPTGQQEFARLVDSMDTNDYLALYTSYNAGTTSWGPVMRNALAQLGSVKVAAANNINTCGVMVGRKGRSSGNGLGRYSYPGFRR